MVLHIQVQTLCKNKTHEIDNTDNGFNVSCITEQMTLYFINELNNTEATKVCVSLQYFTVPFSHKTQVIIFYTDKIITQQT